MKKGTFIFLFIISCAISTKYRVIVYHDEFDNYTKYQLIGNFIGFDNTSKSIRNLIDLQIQRFDKLDTTTYNLVVCHRDKFTLFIEEDESLILLIDNKRYGFKKIGENFDGEWEYAFYSISPDILKKIAFANNIRVKIRGTNISITRDIQSDILAKYQRFYNEYVIKK